MLGMSRVLIVGVFIVFGCSSIEKSQLSSENPEDAISEVQELRDNLQENQIDLLASDQYEDGEKRLNEAARGLKNNDEESDIMENLALAKAYFQKAKTVANKRSVVPSRILRARKATLENEVRKGYQLTQKLEDIDESLRSKTNNFSKALTVEGLSQFEKDYLELEIKSVQNANLRVFRDIVKSAEQNEANKIAPYTYRNASNDLKAAENMIQQSPRNPENYRQSIITIDKSSKLLSDVMNKLKGVAKGASEQVALELVYQERKLGNLSDRTNALEGSLTRSQRNLEYVTYELQGKTSEALNSKNKVQLQSSIDHVQGKFSDDEAEVYQQGNDLIVRLKKIDFQSGSAMIPSQSMKLLSKVNTVINDLKSSKVIVQGHTDSTGKSDNNQSLSVKRSESVAKYLESLEGEYEISSEGQGESQPIANNETSKGRAMNRRVDIIVSTNN